MRGAYQAGWFLSNPVIYQRRWLSKSSCTLNCMRFVWWWANQELREQSYGICLLFPGCPGTSLLYSSPGRPQTGNLGTTLFQPCFLGRSEMGAEKSTFFLCKPEMRFFCLLCFFKSLDHKERINFSTGESESEDLPAQSCGREVMKYMVYFTLCLLGEMILIIQDLPKGLVFVTKSIFS